MELTDKLYEQIARYVNNEMDTAETKSFEEQIQQNEVIAAEVRLYREISSLSESADQKIKGHLLPEEEKKKISDEQVHQMIFQARKEWEEKNENTLKSFYGRKDEPPTEQFKKPKAISMQPWILMAAAVVTGILLIGVLWLAQNKTTPSVTTANKPQDTITGKEQNHPVVVSDDSSTLKTSLPPTKKNGSG